MRSTTASPAPPTSFRTTAPPPWTIWPSEIMSRLAPSGGYQDDVALLLYRHPAPLELDFPADASHLAPTRTALRGWLSRAGVDPDQTLERAHRGGRSRRQRHRARPPPQSRAARSACARRALVDRVQLTVIDTGSWKLPQPTPTTHRGRGHHRSCERSCTTSPSTRRRRHHRPHVREDRLMTTPLTLDTDQPRRRHASCWWRPGKST